MDEPKPLKQLKFESVGEEFIYLYDILIDKIKIEQHITIEELRKTYKELYDKEDSYDDELKERYDSNSKVYWFDSTEKAIVTYLKETDSIKRDKIFSKEINKPLKKLVENIIFNYKLMRSDITVQESINDCLSVLVTKMDKYLPEHGKAYSYFGTISKHHLQSEKKNSYEATKTNLDIDLNIDEANSKPENVYTLEELKDTNDTKSILFDEIILKLQIEIEKPKILPNDKKIAEAIIYIFKNHAMLNVYNKNLLFQLIKEITGLESKEITYSINRLKGFYKIFKQHFLKKLD